MEMEQMDSFSENKEKIFKKAHKITLLCDAEVSIILLNSDNFYEYTSPTSSLKKLIDQYQSRVGVDIWSGHYEKMQEELRRLKDVNTTLTREIMQRKGGELDDLNMRQLCNLEEQMDLAFRNIQERKIQMRIEVCKKKIRNLEDMQKHLRDHLEEEYERRQVGRVVDKDGFDSAAAFAGRVRRPNPGPAAPLQLPRIDEGENSCITTMEIEDSD
ncbi:floral homeotic protein DEFICIENS-like isoform X2 [Salvia miltiorrhiza]|uniref:floral homeotic protein DEFICIENS-like isoform X2 n=1 Tax=Salvia miltiorrhiza TaxID=226208 RepID=UPI0025AB97B9|nr:floral homeotic protein DEFICIENS-like isoform X2 [Salvia miltiorrhiza]